MLRRFSRLLLVDDSKTMLKVVYGMLSELGLENVHCVSDSVLAHKMMQNDKFALIISDWQMKPLDGLQLYRRSREGGRNVYTPFLIMTGYTVKFSAIAREAGYINYIAKPFNVGTLAEKLRQITQEYAA